MANKSTRAGRQISVYLEPDDIERLRLLAKAEFKSSSSWVVGKIRSTFKEVFGDNIPKISP